ncbi:MAG: M23 family metallopeptidase [Kiritimatiellaceae bacterium]|nr:M23 family metallopeptidase [Kiritimatiellaceae bacterium]
MAQQHSKIIRHLFILIAISLVAAGCWKFRSGAPKTAAGPEHADEPAPLPGLLFGFPTPQTRLDDTNNPAVFMPTESGKVESAWYGSTRTRKFGKYFLPAFHEGVDIAPTARDSKGRALDPVFAAADGYVGYISRVGGNSSYGIYVVLLHKDTLGEYFTLYAHLASAAGLKEGDAVTRGTEIGRIGNTSTLKIPVQRSHLHFEFGTMLNDRFSGWFRKEKLKPFHGNMHGYNLAGLNPKELFPYMTNGQHFVFQQYITNCPVAFRLIVPVAGKPDYYCRYPALWNAGENFPCAIVVDVSEGKVPLQARAATEEEAASLRKNKPRVLNAFSEVLGRNGARLIVEKDGQWILGRNGEQWLEILLYR